MYPTPTTQEIEHPKMTLTKTGRRISKDGKNSHSLNLADTVKMYPTPTAGCVEGGEQSSRIEMTEKGGFILRKKNKPEMTFGAKLSDAMIFLEKMYPTPTARDRKILNPKTCKQGNKFNIMAIKFKEQQTWWQTQSEFCGVPNGVSYELDKDRSSRIKALGNSIVPQIARQIGLSIMKGELTNNE
jgi:hypothetical protein